jgi:hypothetical protein
MSYVAVVDSSSLPTGFTGGIPVDNSQGPAVAVDVGGTIDHYHQGLPFTAAGRIVVVLDATVAYYGSGAAPFDANGRLIVTAGPDTAYIAVPFKDGKVVTGLPGGSGPVAPKNYNFSRFSGSGDGMVATMATSWFPSDVTLNYQFWQAQLEFQMPELEENLMTIFGGGASGTNFTINQQVLQINIAAAAGGFQTPVTFNMTELGVAEGDFIALDVAVSDDDTFGAGLATRIVANTVEKFGPNGVSTQMSFQYIGGINATGQPFNGVIRNVVLNDFNQNSPAPNRSYAINEGTGAILADSLQPSGANDATINNFNQTNWIDAPDA